MLSADFQYARLDAIKACYKYGKYAVRTAVVQDVDR